MEAEIILFVSAGEQHYVWYKFGHFRLVTSALYEHLRISKLILLTNKSSNEQFYSQNKAEA